MFQSFLQLSFRTLFKKNLRFTLINSFGLAVGLASFLLVSMFIYDEYQYDGYHSNSDEIYRVVLDFNSDGTQTNWAKTSAPIGKNLIGAFPEVKEVMRLRKNPGTDLLSFEDRKFYEEQVYFADSSLFRIFDIPLLRGNPKEALLEKNSIILTEEMAKRYFPTSDPIGKSLLFNNEVELTITGLMAEIPNNSHFVAEAFITFSSLDELIGEARLSNWGQFDHYTYVLLQEGSDPNSVESKLPQILKTHAPEWVQEKESLFLQPLKSIHLNSNRKDEINPPSDARYSFILGTIALFILLMACANFINLSTATQAAREKEISIQKILGASRLNLVSYFFLETLVICLISLVLGLGIALIFTPYFNEITGKTLNLFVSAWLISPALIFTLLIAVVASILPAWQAIQAGVGSTKKTNGTIAISAIRSALITFQFAISIFLLIATGIVSQQFSFLKSQRLGFDSDQVIIIPVKDRSQNPRHETLSSELNQIPEVAQASFSSSTPGNTTSLTYTYSFVGTEAGENSMSTFLIDENFLNLYKIPIKEGRPIQLNSLDSIPEVLINDATIRQFGLKEPIGMEVKGKVNGKIVGIVDDFNFSTLHAGVDPLILYGFVPSFRFVSVKLKAGEIEAGIAALEKKWPELYPGYPLEFSFLDDQIDQLYRSEYQLTKAYSTFSVIAVVIAAIGLIGLTTFLMSKKLKEISVRKVFGSSTGALILLIYKDYMKVTITAVLLAWIAGYFWMDQWLSEFAFQINPNAGYFLIPATIMVSILLISTGLQIVKATQINPVSNLKEN